MDSQTVLPESARMAKLFHGDFYVHLRARDLNGACLVNSPFGNLADVLKPDPPSGVTKLSVLRSYPVLMLLGKFDMTPDLARRG